MKNLLFLLVIMTSICAIAQTKPDNKNKRPEPVYIVANNGQILSAVGYSLLTEADIPSVRVRRDSVFLTLKEDALKKLDANPKKYYKQEKIKTNSAK